LKFFDPKSLKAQGLVEPSLDRGHPFQRLPQKYRKTVREDVWDLSENSSGVSILFSSDTVNLSVKWSIKHDLRMNHMTDAGIKGVDLYTKRNKNWQYTNTCLPNGKQNEQILFEDIEKKNREYCLYLPLYDTLTDMQIGLDDDSSLDNITFQNKPLVFYGTSITQGGCASRPGLVHTNIISRELGHECINLGFSGNGHLENSIGNIMSNIDTKLYVVECMYNVDKEMIHERIKPLIKAIRANPQAKNTPIVFMEQVVIDMGHLNTAFISSVMEKNEELNKQIQESINEGERDLFIIKHTGAIDDDSEATVDGIHFNDLGFQRYADHFLKNVKELDIL
tara:strand:+ start:310 stop:1320 length:1011 start_codon:yes stop_codon:yes gene_type:complete